jgi:hypothetical protein
MLMFGAIKITQRELATVLPALEYWKEELAEGEEWIPESNYFRKHTPLTAAEIDALFARFQRLSEFATPIEVALNKAHEQRDH